MKQFFSALGLFLMMSLLFVGCSKKPGSVIKDFYEAKTWDEKKAFILDAEGLKSKDVYDEVATYEVKDIILEKKISDSSSIYKFTRLKKLNGKEDDIIARFILVKSGDKEKIDFKTTFCLNEISLKQFVSQKSTKPTKFWVTVEECTQNFHMFSVGIPENIKCVSVNDEDSNGRYWILIDHKENEDARKIYDYSLGKNNSPIQIEFSKFHVLYTVGNVIEDVKFIQEHPIKEE